MDSSFQSTKNNLNQEGAIQLNQLEKPLFAKEKKDFVKLNKKNLIRFNKKTPTQNSLFQDRDIQNLAS